MYITTPLKRFTALCSSIVLATGLSVHAQNTYTTANIDLECQRFIGEVSELNRTKFFNFHAAATNEFSVEEYEKLKELKVGFGRRFWSPFGKYKNYIADNGDFPPLSKIQADGANSIQSEKAEYFYPYVTKQMVVTDHPNKVFDWNMDLEKAGEFTADYFENFYEDGLRPDFYEPMNEPFVHAGDAEFKADQPDDQLVRERMAELFKEIGKAFDERGINTKVVGYSSAWPEMELFNFDHWADRQKMFMDVAGEYMDAFAIHLYDGINVTGDDVNRSGSNSEAILDLVETYSNIKWGVVKPFAITEYGGIEKGYGDHYSPERSIQSVRSMNHILFSLLEREDRLDISIPFITGKAKWHITSENNYQPYGAVLFKPTNVGESNIKGWEFTPRVRFFELWQDVQGKRVRCHTTNPDVFVQSFVDGDKAFVCLNNIDDNAQTVVLNFLSNLGEIENVRIKGLKIFEHQTPIYTDNKSANPPASFVLDPHETVVVTYDFKEPITFKNTIAKKEYYSTTHLQDIQSNTAINFSFNDVDVSATQGEAKLRLGFGRELQLSKRPKVTVNGKEVNVPENWKGYDQSSRKNFFGVIDIPVPYNLLEEDNTVSVVFPDNGGKLSTLILDVQALSDVAPVQTPFGGDASTLPMKVEGEDFDNGGNMVAYYTMNNTNDLGEYRTSEGVDIGSEDTKTFVRLQAGEWVEYTVEVPASAKYTLATTLSSTSEAVYNFQIGRDKETVSSSVNSTDFTTVNTDIELSKGTYTIRMQVAEGEVKVDNIDFTLVNALTDDISFTSDISSFYFGETMTISLDYTASEQRDIILELHTARGLSGKRKVRVEEGTSAVEVRLDITETMMIDDEMTLLAKILPNKSTRPIALAEAMVSDITFDTRDLVTALPDFKIDTNQVNIYPNPMHSSRVLHFAVPTSVKQTQVEIYSFEGKKMDSFQFDTSGIQTVLLGSKYQKGMYVVKLSGENIQATQKLIIGN